MRELLLAIGLEAMYHGNNAEALRVGAPVLSREIYLRGELVMLIKPVDILKAVAGGAMFRPVQLGPPPTEKKLHLVK